MRKKILVSLAAFFSRCLFAAKEYKKHRSLRSLARQETGQLQHCHTSGGIVIGAVVNAVTIHRPANSQMVHVGAQQDDFVFQRRTVAAQDSDDITRGPMLGALPEFVVAGGILHLAAMVAARLNAHLPQLRAELNSSYKR